MSAMVTASPELKRLWIRVLKRVHPDLAVDEQDRRRCEQLAHQANDAYARRDEAALRAVLEPKGPPPPTAKRAAVTLGKHGHRLNTAMPPQSTYRPPPVPQSPLTVSGRPAFAILWAAWAVLCLLLYGIFDALSETGRTGIVVIFAGADDRRGTLVDHQDLQVVLRPQSKVGGGSRQWNDPGSRYAFWIPAVPGNLLFPSARPQLLETRLAPSPWYWDVIKTRVGQSWNPSAVVDTPAGAAADIAFTISRDGSPRDVQLRRPSGYPSLDSSCVLAVQQVKTFGPPEGGAKESLNVLYPCSYSALDAMNARKAPHRGCDRSAIIARFATGWLYRSGEKQGRTEMELVGGRRQYSGRCNCLHSIRYTAAWPSCSPDYGNIKRIPIPGCFMLAGRRRNKDFRPSS